MTIYQVTTSTHELEGSHYISYGIGWADSEIHDISLEKSQIERLVNLCNQLEVETIHLSDVIEDFFGW